MAHNGLTQIIDRHTDPHEDLYTVTVKVEYQRTITATSKDDAIHQAIQDGPTGLEDLLSANNAEIFPELDVEASAVEYEI